MKMKEERTEEYKGLIQEGKTLFDYCNRRDALPGDKLNKLLKFNEGIAGIIGGCTLEEFQGLIAIRDLCESTYRQILELRVRESLGMRDH